MANQSKMTLKTKEKVEYNTFFNSCGVKLFKYNNKRKI